MYSADVECVSDNITNTTSLAFSCDPATTALVTFLSSEMARTMFNSLIRSAVSDAIVPLNNKIVSLGTEIDGLKIENKSLTESMNVMSKELKLAHKQIDDLDQLSRSSSILISSPAWSDKTFVTLTKKSPPSVKHYICLQLQVTLLNVTLSVRKSNRIPNPPPSHHRHTTLEVNQSSLSLSRHPQNLTSCQLRENSRQVV